MVLKRNSFELESSFLGQDFNALIEERGGKGAGLMLIEKGMRHFSSGSGMLYPKSVIIPASFYSRAERIFLDRLGHKIDYDTIKPLRKNRHLNGILEEAYRKCKRAFPGIVSESNSYSAPGWAPSFHLRSSATVEDFRDDSYYGTFKTEEANGFFHQRMGIHHLLNLMISFYEQKIDGETGLGMDDKLAMILMPTIRRLPDRTLHTILYSTYPEDRSAPTAIEIWRKHGYYSGTVQLVFIDDRDRITVHQAKEYDESKCFEEIDCFEESSPFFLSRLPKKRLQEGQTPLSVPFAPYGYSYHAVRYGTEDELSPQKRHELALTRQMHQESNPFEINGQRCSVSALNIQQMRDFAKFFEDTLGYPVNLEFVVADNTLYPVQLRPVPTLPKRREVASLGPLPKEQHLLAETPFVMGSFRARARLAFAHYKNDYAHKFGEPVIMWHDEWYKGHRFYATDDNCLVLFNPYEGAALTHSISLLPPRGPRRDRFKFIGVPDTGLADKLLRCTRDVREKVGDGTGRFAYTPFEITVESDGRRGRMYVDKEYAHYFE